MAGTEFQIGELIENRYRVLSVIGTGGMGTLYRVSDEARDGEVVALKTVRLDAPEAEVPERVERFQREFQILTQLHHPNLVLVYNYGITTEGELYFTMEWVEGQDLEPSRRPWEPGAITPVIIQICRALAYIHARGVIHGDLKPSNVLMAGDTGNAGDWRHRIKIVDFGVALEVRSPEVRSQYYTLGYSAPEARRLRPVDHRMDLYSLGAMWYALLVGEPPLFMPGAERLIPLTLYEALETQDQVPTAIGTVITRLLAQSPADRYASANEVIAAVNEATGSEYVLETRETAGSYALRGQFVGREAEMEMLRALWEQAQEGEGKLVLVSGESGVGKTRLVEEFVVQVELGGARVAHGQCIEGGGVAYRPWREVLRVLSRYVEDADETTMQRLGPVLATLLPELWERDYMADAAPLAELEPQAAQQRLNDAIIQVLRATTGLRPTVIVVEDAHWADEATLDLLDSLARIPGQAGLLVCVTYRDEEVNPEHLLATLAGDRIQRILMQRLPPEVTTDLVRSMLGLEELPSLLTERVQQTTGGNAFFVQELIRSLAEDSVVLQRTVEGWRVDRAALREARLPQSIHQVAGRRLAHLSMEAQQVLRWAAIVGPMFWDGAVEKVGQVPRVQVEAALREGLEQELIFERDTSSFEGQREFLFAKPAVQEVSYESVSREERQGIHSRVAAWLMAHSDEQASEHLGLIGDQLERAGQMEQAATYLRQAGEQAADQFANVEAVTYLNRALDLTPEDEQSKRYAILLAREKVYGLQGAREAQSQDLAVLKKLAQALGDHHRQAEVFQRQAYYYEATGNYPGAIATAQEIIRVAQATQDVAREAAGYHLWGYALWRQGEYEAARPQLKQALALAQEAGARDVEAISLQDLGVVSNIQGDSIAAQTYMEQALHICRELGNRQDEAVMLNNLGIIFIDQGDYTRALAHYEQSFQIARELGDRRSEDIVLGNLGEIAATFGDYTKARIYQDQALHTCHEVGDRLGECLALSSLSQLSHNLGDDETAQEYSRQALRIAQEIGSRRAQGDILTTLGHTLAGLERLAEAADAYQQALTLRRELGQHSLAMEPIAGLARISLAQGNLAQAQTQVEEILTFLETHTLAGTESPFRIHLTCYRVLCANQDTRAQAILNTAYRLLQERASKITDEEKQRSFLENVAAHRDIVKAWEEWANQRVVNSEEQRGRTA